MEGVKMSGKTAVRQNLAQRSAASADTSISTTLTDQLRQLHVLPDILRSHSHYYHNPKQFRYRRAGRWHDLSANEFVSYATRLAFGLLAKGMAKGEHVALIGRPSPFWLAMDLAIQSAGGVTVPLFVDGSREHLRYCLKHCSIRMALVDGEAGAETLRRTDHPLYLVACHHCMPTDNWIDSRQLMREGDDLAITQPQAVMQTVSQISDTDIATVIFTSGSTGEPKGVPLSHANLLYQIRCAADAFQLSPQDDLALSSLPLAHVFERMVSLSHVAARVPICFVDDIGNLAISLEEVRPTFLTTVPRILEKVHDRIVIRASQGNIISKRLASWAIRRAEQGGGGWLHGVADKVLYQTIRDRFGGRLRALIVGGAPLRKDIESFFRNAGLPLYQGYGMTEASPVITVNRPGLDLEGTVGKPFPGTDIRLGQDNEILVRGPGVMHGYLHDDGLTVDDEGWLHTGDLGSLDADGFLRITGRKKELLKTAGGKYVSPLPIEQSLTRLPLVDRALIIAEGRPFVSAILFVDPDQLDAAKQRAKQTDLDDQTFLQSEAMRNRFAEQIATVNEGLDHWQQIRHYEVIAEMPSVENGLLTATQKLRRGKLRDHYQELIDTCYKSIGVDDCTRKEAS